MWNPALMERLLIAIITTGAHLSPKKWKEAASSFYSCSQQFIDIFHADEEKAIRRLKEKFAEEQKKICQTMGWRDYNQGNLSAFDGDLGPVEVKMRQIIQEQDEKKDEKEGEGETKKAWRNWSSIFGRAHGRIVKAKEQALDSIEKYYLWEL